MKLTLLCFLLISSHAWGKWSVSTYNIRNFDKDRGAGSTNLAELHKIVQTVKSEVMAFEEVVNVKAFDKFVKSSLPGYEYQISGCGDFGKQHLAIAYNPKVFKYVSKTEDLSFSDANEACGSLRPVFLVTLKHQAERSDYTFGAVHLKAGGDQAAYSKRWAQYKKLSSLTARYAKTNLILLGDFNTTGYDEQNEDFVKFEDFIDKSNLRTMSDSLTCTSYWAGNTGSEEYDPSVLDHIVVQDKLNSRVESVVLGAHCARTSCRPVKPEALGESFRSVSDHCPIKVTFN